MKRIMRVSYRMEGCESTDMQVEIKLTGKETLTQLELKAIEVVRQDEHLGDVDDKFEFTEITVTLIP